MQRQLSRSEATQSFFSQTLPRTSRSIHRASKLRQMIQISQHLKQKNPWYHDDVGLFKNLQLTLLDYNIKGAPGIYNFYEQLPKSIQTQQTYYAKFSSSPSLYEYKFYEIKDQKSPKQSPDEIIKYYESSKKVISKNPSQFDSDQKFYPVDISICPLPIQVSSLQDQSQLNLLKSLKFCSNKSIFQTPVLQAIINRLWKANRKYIILNNIIYSLIYIIFINILQAPNWYENGTADFFFILAGVLAVLSLLSYLRFCCQDSKAFCKHDLWIFLDLILVIFIIKTAILSSYQSQQPQNDTTFEWLIVISLSLAWARSFQIFRLFDCTRKFSRVLTEILKVSFPFILILITLTIAFANLMVISIRYQTGNQIKAIDFFRRWFDGYMIETGGLDPSGYSTLSSYIYIVISFLGAIIMINMLIAIMSDTQAYVNESHVKFQYRQKITALITHGYIILNKFCRNYRHRKTFLVIFKRKQLESIEEQEWQGQVGKIKKIIHQQLTELEERIKKTFKGADKILTHQDQETEVGIN